MTSIITIYCNITYLIELSPLILTVNCVDVHGLVCKLLRCIAYMLMYTAHIILELLLLLFHTSTLVVPRWRVDGITEPCRYYYITCNLDFNCNIFSAWVAIKIEINSRFSRLCLVRLLTCKYYTHIHIYTYYMYIGWFYYRSKLISSITFGYLKKKFEIWEI